MALVWHLKFRGGDVSLSSRDFLRVDTTIGKKVLHVQKLYDSHCDLSHSFPPGQECLVCLLVNLFAYYSRLWYPRCNSLKRRSWLSGNETKACRELHSTCRTPLRISAIKKKEANDIQGISDETDLNGWFENSPEVKISQIFIWLRFLEREIRF